MTGRPLVEPRTGRPGAGVLGVEAPGAGELSGDVPDVEAPGDEVPAADWSGSGGVLK